MNPGTNFQNSEGCHVCTELVARTARCRRSIQAYHEAHVASPACCLEIRIFQKQGKGPRLRDIAFPHPCTSAVNRACDGAFGMQFRCFVSRTGPLLNTNAEQTFKGFFKGHRAVQCVLASSGPMSWSGTCEPSSNFSGRISRGGHQRLPEARWGNIALPLSIAGSPVVCRRIISILDVIHPIA